MQLIIQGHGIELTPSLRDYAAKKIGKIEEFYGNIQKITVTLDARCHSDSTRSHVAEVSIWLSGKKLIHASEAGQDMYAAIDLVLAELERQVKKHKEKHIQEHRREAEKMKQLSHTYVPEKSDEPRLVTIKRFDISVMPRDAALEEQKKLGYEFFLFRNAETGEINVTHDGGVIAHQNADPMTEEEAARKLIGQGISFFAFRNSGTDELNVIYRRKSGNLGLIEPSL